MMRRVILALACAFWFSIAAWQTANAAPPDLPKGFAVPDQFHEDATRRQYWDFDSGQYDFIPAGQKSLTHQKVEGHLWRTPLSTTAVPLNQPDGVITLLADSMAKDGWTILRRQGTFVAHKNSGGTDLWLSGTGNAGYFSLVLMESASPSRSLTLPAPKAEIETVADNQSLPYALPLPGSKQEKSINDHRSFDITLPGGAEKLFATSDLTRWYDEPSGVSSYEFVAVYRKALETAGWTVVNAKVAGDAVVVAHFTKNGRDIWLYTRGDGGKQNINVADYGAQSAAAALKKQLGKDGHVALYGIYFDTDKDVPRPESEPTLQNVLQLLKDDPTLKLEVQGHTDNVGAADHNAKLSDARAAGIKKWLVDHGIGSDRLTSKGYGAAKPVADNNTPEGRAKNRRVELARP
jgi:outer membrane protein OmpA-like peptidoglycan-associated protein